MSAILREAKFEKVMREFKHGTLRSSSGDAVTNPAQARAIAYSEAGYPRRKSAKRRRARRVAKGGGLARMLAHHFAGRT